LLSLPGKKQPRKMDVNFKGLDGEKGKNSQLKGEKGKKNERKKRKKAINSSAIMGAQRERAELTLNQDEAPIQE